MRSEVPKVLHRICGKPMVEWVVDAAREAGASRVVCVVRPGDGVAEGLPDGVEVAEQHEGEGTGAAVLAARDVVEPGPFLVLSGDHPLVTAEADRRPAAPRNARREPPPRCSPPSCRTRPATAASSATATARSSASSRPSTPRRSRRRTLAIREINLGTYVFEAPALFDGLEQVTNQDGERFLTGRLPGAEGRGRADRHLHDRRSRHRPRRERPRRPDGGRGARAAPHPRGARPRRRDLPPPGSTRVEADVKIGVDTVDRPRREPARRPRASAAAARSARTPPRATPASATSQRRALVPRRGRGPATTRTIGPFAYLRPGTVVRERRQGRHVRRGQELRHRRGRQGAPPLLHRRRRRGRGRQPRRQHDHRQLRRPRASTARRSEKA